MNARKRVEMKQFSDCDFPSTKEEVKIEEVKLRGDNSYRYKGIPVIKLDMNGDCIYIKDQLECTYCGEIYPDQTNLEPYIEKNIKRYWRG